jgi:uncharacterized protein (UPF0332 family)
MKWDEFLDTADRLSKGSSEGDWRSACSRAYYAVFHYFREYLLAHGVDLGKSGAVHQNLKIGLLNCGINGMPAIGIDVDRLLDSRSVADYVLATTVTRFEADKAVQRARTLIADFTAILAVTPAATIAAAIRAFLVRFGRIPP